MKKVIGYVIMTINDSKETKYLYYDKNAMCYNLAFSIDPVALFPTIEQAEELMLRADFVSENTYSNGTKRPPRLIDIAIGLCDKKRKGSCTFQIVPLELNLDEAIIKLTAGGEIKEPK